MSSSEKYLVPAISSAAELSIPWKTLETIIGGASIIDVDEIHVPDLSEARKFLSAYGVDLDQPDDFSSALSIRDMAIIYLNETLLPYGEIKDVPHEYLTMQIDELLVAASNWDRSKWPAWPCILLKVLHCVSHALWTHDTEAHKQAVSTIQRRIEPYLRESNGHCWIGDDNCSIPLQHFEIKEEKSFSRTMTKLLLKPGNLSIRIFDRLGMRFVTYDIFSAILLIKFLRSRHIIMYANNLPERTRNSLAEFEEIRALYERYLPDVDAVTREESPFGQLARENNPFSGRKFKMIKFIERLLVKLDSNRRVFFPYEIQVLDSKAWAAIQKGEARHEAYERRQEQKVRERIFGEPPTAG